MPLLPSRALFARTVLVSGTALWLGCSSSPAADDSGGAGGSAGGGAGASGSGGAQASGGSGAGKAGSSGTGGKGGASGAAGKGGAGGAGKGGAGGAGKGGAAGAPAGSSGSAGSGGAGASAGSGGAGGNAGSGAPGGAGGDAGSGASAGSPGTGGGGAAGAGGGPVTTMPTNILNNGGFEAGLMCYGQYEWGSDPSQTGTGYQFSLSTDAHGGAYSLQIACVKDAECGFPAKAAVQGTGFHTPHSQAYKVSVYTKCAAGNNAFFYTPNSDAGDFVKAFTCTGDWAETQFSFTSSATSDYVAYSLYNAGKSTLLIDDLVITYGDGTVPPQTVKHAGTRSAQISGTTFTVDGKPYLPLGFYQIPAEDLAQAKQMGVNTVAWADPGCYNTDAPAYADAAYEAGINIMPESSSTARLNTPALFPQVMKQFGGHLADIAWYLIDEPDLDAWVWQPVAPDVLTAEYTALRGASPLPVGAMLQRSHYDQPQADQPYAGAMDIYMSEPYGSSFDGIPHTMSVVATMTKRPVWFAEDDSLDPSLIVPKAYFAFTAGGTGLFYFTWSGLKADGKLDAAAQAITELSSLTDAITGPDIGAQVTAPAGISYLARSAGGKTYILAVNPAASNVTGDFGFPGLSAGKTVTVQFEGRTITPANGSFTDTFTGISRHVYVID